MKRFARLTSLAAAGAAVALVLAGCAGGADEAAKTDAETGSDTGLTTVEAGVLTIATSNPSYEPWFVDNDPSNGEGFEAAVAYAVAEKLGYSAAKVKWVNEEFEASITPGDKPWDLNIQQFSITDERRAAVDFSTPYYIASQAVVANADTAAGKAKTLADLKDTTIGVASGSTALSVVEKTLPDAKVQVFNNVADAVLALNSGNIDAIVTDLPAAYYIAGAQLDNGVLVGQLAAEGTDGDKLGFVLPKDSPNTSAVSKAVDELRADGTIEALIERWLVSQDAPILK